MSSDSLRRIRNGMALKGDLLEWLWRVPNSMAYVRVAFAEMHMDGRLDDVPAVSVLERAVHDWLTDRKAGLI